MPTGNATVRLLLPSARTEIDVDDVSIQLDTCADSTQTLGDMFNCLKPPIEIDEGYQALSIRSNSRRYQSGNQTAIDVLQDIDENAFSGAFNVSRDHTPIDDLEDLVNDDVPFNLAFVESYYGHQSSSRTSPSSSRMDHDIAEEQGDELLAEGIISTVHI
jgi:autophagy-related protein 2